MKNRLRLLPLICMVALLALACAPAYADNLTIPGDGLYTVGVTSSSSMFRVVKCVLHVRDGQISAVLTLSGRGYGYLYPGTIQQADAAPQETWVPFVVDSEGKYTYTIPIPSLDMDLDVAAYSTKYSKWYPRILNFESAGLREYTAIPPDGEYLIGVVSGDEALNGLECGLSVQKGAMTATLEGPEGVEAFKVESMDRFFTWKDTGIMLDSATLRDRAFAAQDGVYTIDVTTDSGLLSVSDCTIRVKDGKMVALLTTRNAAYDYLYAGPAKDARKDEKGWIPAAVNDDGTCTFILEIPAIDSDVAVATHSAQKGMWYDRTIRFDSGSMTALP